MNSTSAGKASCIMATSGRASLASRSCALFARQRFPDRELIIVADTGELERDPAWDQNITLLEVPPGTAIGTRRNLACHHATGDWIVQWDDDDWRGAGCLDALLAPLQSGEADVVGFADTPFYEVQGDTFWNTGTLLRILFAQGIHPGTLAFRKDIWETSRYPAKTGGEDLDLLRKFVRGGARIRPVDSCGGEHFIYVRHGENTWDLKCGQSHGKDSWARIPEDRIPEVARLWLGGWNCRSTDTASQMTGVTIASPIYRGMAEEAAARFTWATGFPAFVLCEPSELCYLAKLDLHKNFAGTVIYFDADLWFLRKTDLSPYIDREPFFAVPDPGRFLEGQFPCNDCRVLDIEPAHYFNTALMIWNQRHRRLWESAQEIRSSGKYPNLNDPRRPEPGGGRLDDFGEQSYINAGRHHSGTLFEPLPTTLNYFPFAARNDPTYPRIPHPITCHAAGYGIAEKLDVLKFFSAQWSEKKSA